MKIQIDRIVANTHTNGEQETNGRIQIERQTLDTSAKRRVIEGEKEKENDESKA